MVGASMASRSSLPQLALVLALCGVASAAAAQEAPGAIRAIVVRGALDGLRWPRFPDYAPALTALYEPRAFEPLWLDDDDPTDSANEAIALLRDAGLHGLDARDYDADLLTSEAERLDENRRSAADARARFDVALSVAVLRYLSDVHIGRVNPRTVEFGYDVTPRKLDLASVVAGALRDGRIARAMIEAGPAYQQHKLLEDQLALYRELAADATLAPPALAVKPGKKIVAGDALAEAPALARWLTALGDLPADAATSPLYEGALVDAVRRFQSRHGLDPDGVIGPATAKALAVPAGARARQIELALERLRWIPSVETGRVVFVNVPGFELTAFDAIGSDAAPALTMPVVVGKAARTQTPVFAGTMRTVVFAPYWNVPRSIVRGEILPKLATNAGYLASQNMEIVAGGSAVATNADTIAALASGGVRLRQRPGPKNSLGRVKFLFPNPHDVYLHDTPSQSLFQRPRRDFSHGCIRVADPEALARWVLAPEGWDEARVAAGLALKRERAVPLTQTIPVVIYYTTAVARGDGTISFYEDIYRYDAALERALAKRFLPSGQT